MTDIFTVNLPDIGEGVVEGEVVEWLKKEGDTLAQDEPVVQVMTDKATVELPAVYPGVLSKQYISVGNIAVKDKPLYDITLDESVEAKGSKPAESDKSEEKVETPKTAEEESLQHQQKQRNLPLQDPVVRKLLPPLLPVIMHVQKM